MRRRSRPAQRWWALIAVVAVWWPAVGWAQLAPDHLTAAEADQMQDAAGHFDKRISLLLQFAQARLDDFEQTRAAAPGPVRDATLYRDLGQFTGIVGELDDNVDDLVQNHVTSETEGAKFDVAKILDGVIATETHMNEALHRIQTESAPADLANYHFELDDCLDAVGDSLKTTQDDREHVGQPHGA